MANAQNLLAAAKKQKTNGGSNQQAVNTNNIAPRKPMGEQRLYTSNDFESLENLYFNPQDVENDPVNEAYEIYPNGEKRKVYDPEEDMKEMASFNFSNVESNMPKAILESLMSNPLNMPSVPVSVDRANLEENIQNKSMDIINKLDARDKQGKKGQQLQQPEYITESVPSQPMDIDYKQLATIIESIIDKRMSQWTNKLLTESKNVSQNTPNLAFMKLGNSFTCMDDNNNVYECKMIYKGKGKVKKS